MSAKKEILMKFITTQNEKVRKDVSMQGYKDNSPYRNNPFNFIYGTPDGTNITMKGVSVPVLGIDELGNKQQMMPGQDYFFPGSRVREEKLTMQSGGQSPYTVTMNNPFVIQPQGMLPTNYYQNLPKNEAGIPYDKDGTLFTQSKVVSRYDENGKPLSSAQIRENQKMWNMQKIAYSPEQQTFNLWKNNPQNTAQGYYSTREYDKYLKSIVPKGKDVGLDGLCDPNFSSTKCGTSKQHAKEDKKEWSKKQEGGEQDFTNVQEWFNKYIDSPLYRRNIENSGYENVDDVIAQRKANVNRTGYELDENRLGTYYKNTSNKIHNAPKTDSKNWSKKYPSVLPNDSVLAHEFGHAVLDSNQSWFGSLKPFWNKNDYDQLESRNKNKRVSRGAMENYADQKELQYTAAKLGIYNPGFEEFTEEHLDKLPTDLKDRALQNYSKEDLIWLMNNIAQNDDNSNDQLAIAQIGGATRADSLAVYNNTRAIEDYYKKQGYIKERVKDSEKHKKNIKSRKKWINETKKYLKESENTPVHTFYTQQDKNKDIAEKKKNLKEAQQRLFEVNDKIDPKKYLKRLEESKISFEKRPKDSGKYIDEQNNLVEEKPSIEKFYLPIDENKFYQREQSAGFLDLRSPMPLYDKRIVPQYLSELKSPDLILQDQIQDKMHKAQTVKERDELAKQYADLIYTDNVEMYEYEPLAVMPFDMIPPELQRERVEKYGLSGVPKSIIDAHPEWLENTNQPTKTQTLQPRVEALNIQPIKQTPINIPVQELDFNTPIKAPKSYNVNMQRYNMQGPSDYYQANEEGVDYQRAMEIKAASDAYNKYIQEKYGNEEALKNPKAVERLKQLKSEFKIESNYKFGGDLNQYQNGSQTWDKQKQNLKNEKLEKLKRLLSLPDPVFKAKTFEEKIAEKIEQEKRKPVAKDNTATRGYNNASIHSNAARNKTDKEIADERRQIRQQSDANVLNSYSLEAFKPSNYTRENLSEMAKGLESKFRVSDEPNFFDDYLNPFNMIGGMASNLGQAPLQAKESDSYLPYVTSIGAPLTAGALAGLGANSTKQFVNNLVNPLAGTEDSFKKLYNNGDIINSSVNSAGIPNPIAIIDKSITRPPTPLQILGIEDSWNNYSPLNYLPGYGKKLNAKGELYGYPGESQLFNNDVLSPKANIIEQTTSSPPVGFRKFGNSIKDVIETKTLRPNGNGMGSKQIKGEGNWAEPGKVNEHYSGVFEATMNPNVIGSDIKLQEMHRRNGIVGTTTDGNVAIPLTDPGLSFNRRLPFSNRYVPINKEKLINNEFQLATQLPHLQSVIEKYGLYAGGAGALGYISGGKEGAKENIKTLNKYTIDPIINNVGPFLKNNNFKNGGLTNFLQKAQEGRTVTVDYGDNIQKKILTDSREYSDLYNEGKLGVKNDDGSISMTPLQEVVITPQNNGVRKEPVYVPNEIRQHIPQGYISKTWDVITNPMTAFGYIARNEDVPDYFTRGERNNLDMATDVINPAAWVNYAGHGIKDISSVPGKLMEGDFEGASKSTLSGSLNLLSVIPIAQELKPFVPSTVKTLPKAKNFREALGTFIGIPTEQSLPRLSPQELKIYRQVQEIGRLRATGKPISEQYRYALDQNIPDEHFEKVFGRTKAEVEQILPSVTEQETFRSSIPIRERFNLERAPRRRSSSDTAINQINNQLDIRTASPEQIQEFANRVGMSVDELTQFAESSLPQQTRDGVIRHTLSDYGLDADIERLLERTYNPNELRPIPEELLININNRGRTIINGQNPRLTLKETAIDDWERYVDNKVPINTVINDKFSNIVSKYPYYKGPVSENVPSLSLSTSGNLKNVSKTVGNQSTSGVSSGDVFTGSLNTSHSSYLPQIKQIFKYTEGAPQFLGYKPMNHLGFLSDFRYSQDDIAKYLNTEIDQQISRGVLPKNILRPYVTNKDKVILPHYGIKQFKDGGLGDVTIVNNRIGNYLKSLRGNNGMFDMTNSNIYKSILPVTLGIGAASQLEKNLFQE